MAHTGTKSMKDDDDTMCYRSELEAAVKAEREACAKVAEEWQTEVDDPRYQKSCADAIRARGNT